MSKYNNSAEFLMLSKIYDRLGKLISATMTGGSGAGNFEFIAKFTVGGGGGAPADGETEYANPAATGAVMLFKNGVGWLTEGVHYSVLVGGGVELLIGEFTTNEVYSVWKDLS